MESNYQPNRKYKQKKHSKEQTLKNNLIIDDEASFQENTFNSSTSTTPFQSSNANSNNKKKWKCQQCTYENWQSSLKCTICLNKNTATTSSYANNTSTLKKKHVSISKFQQIDTTSYKSPSPTPLYEIELLDFENKSSSANNNNASKHSNNANINIGQQCVNNDIDLALNENSLNAANKSSTNVTCDAATTKSIKFKTNGIDQDLSFMNDSIRVDQTNSYSENLNNTSDTNSTTVTSPEESLLNDSNSQNKPNLVEKWTCSICTYLNWPKSLKCIQCYTPKSANNCETNLETTDLDANLSIQKNKNKSDNQITQSKSNSNNQLAEVNSQVGSLSNRSVCSSPNPIITNTQQKQSITDLLSSRLEQTSLNKSSENIELSSSSSPPPTPQTANVNNAPKKWSCSVCTYQNWPKSQRCVMCHVPRNNNLAKTTVPTTTTNGSNKRNVINLGLSNNRTNSNSNNNLTDSKNFNIQEQLSSYQIKMDRLFLSACQGIVDGDMTNLNLYIQTGGDLTRYLTFEECKLLNRENVFHVGLTLIHLCYRFKSKDFLIKLLNQSNKLKKLYLNNNNNNKNNMNLIKSNRINTSSSASPSSIKSINTLLKHVNKTKFSPCQSCPSLASNIIDRYFSANLRQRITTVQNNSFYSNSNFLNNDTTNVAEATNTYKQHSYHYHHVSPTSSLVTLNNAHNSPSPSPPPGATSSYYSNRNQPHSSSCFYVNESHTFTLPNEIDEFSPQVQQILFDELLDRDVQQELENESRIINWNMDLCTRLNSRLYPLWNRHSGDCLLDSVLQACFGVFDTENILRRTMAESLEQYSNCFKPRWKEHEILMAQSLDYKLNDHQLEHDWNNILALANQPGASLEQAHIFALCHIFRRPIIVYSVKYVKSFRGENIGFTHFEGVYLPLIWEPSFCFKMPIALGYTRGHFTALVMLEKPDIIIPYFHSSGKDEANEKANSNDDNMNAFNSGVNKSNSNDNINNNNNTNGNMTNDSNYMGNANMMGAVSNLDENQQFQTFYLPLTNQDGKLLPIHFLKSSELGRERLILRQYLNLDCFVTQGSNCALIVAQQRVAKRSLLVKQMLDEWLSYYRSMQNKERKPQIEICKENEDNEICMDKHNEISLKNHLSIGKSSEAKEDEDDDEDDEDEDDEDEFDDDDDDDEEDDDEDDDEDEEEEENECYDNEICEEVNVQ